MTSAADLVAETERYLLGGQPPSLNRLNGPVGPNATALVFAFDPKSIEPGTYVAVDLELYYVWAVDQPSKTATVEPGQAGSTSAAHSDGATVVAKPKFSKFAVLQAINQDLVDLSSPYNGLFQVKTVTLTSVAGQIGYDLTDPTTGPVTDMIGEPIEFRYQTSATSTKDWPVVDKWDLARDMPTATFPSGMAVILYGGADSGFPVRMKYRAPFSPLAALTDDVEDVAGLPPSAHDIPPLGAAARLVPGREVKRNFTESQGDSRRASEVPANATMHSADGLRGIRERRILAEAARLAAEYPIDMRN